MKLTLALRKLHRSEASLDRRLRRVAERHRADHDVFYLCAELAGWSESHLRQLAWAGQRHGVRLDGSPPRHGESWSSLREKTSELIGRRPEPGALLLADLRSVHLRAAAVSVDWVLLAQGAQEARDTELLALVSRCHPDTLRQLQWTNTMMRKLAPQMLMDMN